MEPVRLLLVDDEDDFRLATARALGRRGFAVTPAESGERALELLAAAEELPDVVLLDLRMEGLDGLQTLQRIRRRHGDLPVVILTGHGGFDDALVGYHLEIVDFVQKPVDVEKLALHIRGLLARPAQEPLRERTVSELMVPVDAYPEVRADQQVRELVALLRDALFPERRGKVTEGSHRTVVLRDEEGAFLGLLRIQDLLALVVPAYLRASPYSSYFTGLFLAQCKVVGTRLAGDLPRNDHAIAPDTPLMEAAQLMVQHSLINLPVVKGGALLGILRDKDLLLELAAQVALES